MAGFAFNQTSPGIETKEFDQTTSVAPVSTSIGGVGGLFAWGPVGEIMEVSSEPDFVNQVGKPSNYNSETWFAATNFFDYANQLLVSRGANTTGNTTFVFPAGGNFGLVTNNNLLEVTSGNSQMTTNTSNANFSFTNNAVFPATVGNYILIQRINIANTSNVISSNFRQILGINSSVVILDNPINMTTVTDTSNSYISVSTYNGTLSAFANTSTVDNPLAQMVLNHASYNTVNFSIDVPYVAKWPGALGDSLRISVCDSANQYSSNITLTNCNFTVGSFAANLSFSSPASAQTAWSALSNNDYLLVGNTTIGSQYIQIQSTNTVPQTNTITLGLVSAYTLSQPYIGATTIQRNWEFFRSVGSAPGQTTYVAQQGNTSANDAVHVAVIDQNGAFTNVPGALLKVYQGLSRATDAKNSSGTTNYYVNVINGDSPYIWWANDRSGAYSNTARNIASSLNSVPLSLQFVGGQDGLGEGSIDVSTITSAWDLFKDKTNVDVDYLIGGKSLGGLNGELLPNYIQANIIDVRNDVMGFFSPAIQTVVNNIGNEINSMVNFMVNVNSSKRCNWDSGYKYQYDKYNDVYRWIPMNGDTAGTRALTDTVRAPWYSNAGYNRGLIKNVTKLAFNPGQIQQRNILFQNRINPIVIQKGFGAVLLGDQTATPQTSAFNANGTTNLFIYLEKIMTNASLFTTLFEFNDAISRQQWINLVTPVLRSAASDRAFGTDAQGNPGFKAQCDTNNNTDDIINSYGFVGDIYIIPNHSVRYIQLNFTALNQGTDLSFKVIGA